MADGGSKDELTSEFAANIWDRINFLGNDVDLTVLKVRDLSKCVCRSPGS